MPLKALLDARVGLHDPRVRLTEYVAITHSESDFDIMATLCLIKGESCSS